VFVSVRAVNAGGMTTTVHSNGVFLSYLSQGLPPLQHIGVYDAHKNAHGDM